MPVMVIHFSPVVIPAMDAAIDPRNAATEIQNFRDMSLVLIIYLLMSSIAHLIIMTISHIVTTALYIRAINARICKIVVIGSP